MCIQRGERGLGVTEPPSSQTQGASLQCPVPQGGQPKAWRVPLALAPREVPGAQSEQSEQPGWSCYQMPGVKEQTRR